MRESPIELFHVELCVGDAVRMDDQILTVLEICKGEVTFRIDDVADVDLNEFETVDFDYGKKLVSQSVTRLPPR